MADTVVCPVHFDRYCVCRIAWQLVGVPNWLAQSESLFKCTSNFGYCVMRIGWYCFRCPYCVDLGGVALLSTE